MREGERDREREGDVKGECAHVRGNRVMRRRRGKSSTKIPCQVSRQLRCCGISLIYQSPSQ